MAFQLQLTPTMFLQTHIDSASSVEITPAINLGEWTMIYASYIYSYGGHGLSTVYINGVLTHRYAITATARGPSFFSNTDEICVGRGFIGNIRRVQLFSPTPLQLSQGIFYFTLSSYKKILKRRLCSIFL